RCAGELRSPAAQPLHDLAGIRTDDARKIRVSSMQFESSGAQADTGAPSAPGARLRQAGERRGDSIAEVARALKLAPRQVDALERGDYEALPGPAFVRGFMRNYARYLNLDPDPLVAETSAGLERLRVDLSPVTNA